MIRLLNHITSLQTGVSGAAGRAHLVHHNPLGGRRELQFLRQLPQLEYLDVGGAQRTDSGLWSLSLTEAGMQVIASLAELRELRLAGTAVTTRGLAALQPLAKLQRLNLQGCKRLRDDAAAVLAAFRQLRILDVNDSGLSGEAVTRLRAALPECQILY